MMFVVNTTTKHKMTRKKQGQLLKALGFNKASEEIYLTLLRTKGLTPTEISQHTGLYRPYVYDNIKKLEENKAVIKILRNKKTLYRATEPKLIIDELERRKNEIKEELEQIKRNASPEKKNFEIETYEGNKGLQSFYDHLQETIVTQRTKTLLVYGGTGQATTYLKYYFPNLLKQSYLKKIHNQLNIKMIYNSTAKESEIVKKYKKILDLKITQKKHDKKSTTIITDKSVSFMDLERTPFIFKTFNDNIIESQKKIFEELWNR